MYSVINSPQNALVLQALMARARADAWHHKMRSMAYGATAIGALLICGSVAWLIYDNGTALAQKQMADAGRSFGQSFVDAVGHIPLEGTVKMVEPGSVIVRQDAPLHATGDVTVHQDKPFVIAQDKALQVAGEIAANNSRPTEAQMAQTAEPPSKAKVVTNYTTFKTVAFQQGKVVTGWRFDDTLQDRPSYAYCYYSQTLEDHAEATLYIGEDGTFTKPKHVPDGLDVSAAFENCVWDK